MYANKIVVAIKSHGKTLREVGETTYLPFGSEYSILIKNLNTVRASVKIFVDGVDASESVTFVVPASGQIEIERFVRAGNLNQGNKFKFIERTSKIENHRGVNAEDGLIRVEYQFEQEVYANSLRSIQCSASSVPYKSSRSLGSVQGCVPKNATGITAPGAVSNQKFQEASAFVTSGQKFSIVLQLRGTAESGSYVTKALESRSRVECKFCGSASRSNAKFCAECGAALTII